MFGMCEKNTMVVVALGTEGGEPNIEKIGVEF